MKEGVARELHEKGARAKRPEDLRREGGEDVEVLRQR